MGSLRHWVQASWNHCRQLRHCSIFRFHLKGNGTSDPPDTSSLTAPNPAHHSSAPSAPRHPALLLCSHPRHLFPNPALHYSLPRATTVTVALLPVAQMPSVPVQPLQSIRQGELHAQHGPGVGALLQRTPPLWVEQTGGLRSRGRKGSGGWGWEGPQGGALTLVAMAKTHWRQTQDTPSPSPGAGALGTWQSW